MKNTYNAKWWSSEDDSSWERTKEAFRRDWEQTKHDFGGKSPDLNQDVPDTVKQAAGKQSIPPAGQPNFDDYEPAFRFGHGARRHYSDKYPTWNNELEGNLRNDWSTSNDAPGWEQHREAIRRGYEYNRLETTSH